MGKRPAQSKPALARRLPSGAFAYRGKARAFSDLPKREQSRFRSVWASKAARTTRAARAAPLVEPAGAVKWIKPKNEHVKGKIPSLRIRKGEDPGKAIDRLTREQKTQRMAPVVTLRWADGTRTKASIALTGNNADNRKAARDWIRQIQSSGGENLRGDKGSKGKGKPKVESVALVHGARKSKNQRRREARISPAEREAIAYYVGAGMGRAEARAAAAADQRLPPEAIDAIQDGMGEGYTRAEALKLYWDEADPDGERFEADDD